MDRTAHMPDARFAYRDLVIPLHLCLEGSRYPTPRELAAFHGYDGVVTKHLEVAAREGWYPDESVDWESLQAAGQFAKEPDSGLDGSTEGAIVYRSVTIRLKRLAARG